MWGTTEIVEPSAPSPQKNNILSSKRLIYAVLHRDNKRELLFHCYIYSRTQIRSLVIGIQLNAYLLIFDVYSYFSHQLILSVFISSITFVWHPLPQAYNFSSALCSAKYYAAQLVVYYVPISSMLQEKRENRLLAFLPR